MDRSVFACVLISFVCISGITASLEKGSDTNEETTNVSERFQDAPAVEEFVGVPSETSVLLQAPMVLPQDYVNSSHTDGPSDSKDRIRRFPMTNQQYGDRPFSVPYPQFQQYRQEQKYDLCPQMAATCPTCVSHISQLPNDICHFPVVIKVLLLSAPTIDNVGRICGKFGLLSAHSHTDIRQFRRLLRFSSRDSCGCNLKPSQQYFLISQLSAFIKDGSTVYSKVSLSDQAILLSVDRFTESDVLNFLRCSQRAQYPQQFVPPNQNPSYGPYPPEQPSYTSQSSVFEFQSSNVYNIPAQPSVAPAPFYPVPRPNVTYPPYQTLPSSYQTPFPPYQESPPPNKVTLTQYQTPPQPYYQTPLQPLYQTTPQPSYQTPPQPLYQTSSAVYETPAVPYSDTPPYPPPRYDQQTYELGGYPPLIRPRPTESSYEYTAPVYSGAKSYPAPIDQSDLYRQQQGGPQFSTPDQYGSNITPQPFVPPYAPQPASSPEPYKTFPQQAHIYTNPSISAPYFSPLPPVSYVQFSTVDTKPYNPTPLPCEPSTNSSVSASAYSSQQEIPPAYNQQAFGCSSCPRISRISPSGLENSFCNSRFAYIVAFTFLNKPNPYTDQPVSTCQKFKARVLYDVSNELPVDKNVEYLMFSHCPGLLNNFGSVIVLLLGFNIPPPSGPLIELTENFELIQLPSPSTVVLPRCQPFPYGFAQYASPTSDPAYYDLTTTNLTYASSAIAYDAPTTAYYTSPPTTTEYFTYGPQSAMPAYDSKPAVYAPEDVSFSSSTTPSYAHLEETTPSYAPLTTTSPYASPPTTSTYASLPTTSTYASPPTTSAYASPPTTSKYASTPTTSVYSTAAPSAQISYEERQGQSQSSFAECPVGTRTNSFECPVCSPYWSQQNVDEFCSSEFRIVAEVLTTAQISRQTIAVPLVSITKNVAENYEKTIIIEIEARPKSCIEGRLRIIEGQGISNIYTGSNILPFVFLSECSCDILVANTGTKLLISGRRPPHVLRNGVIQFTNDTQVAIAHYGVIPECLQIQNQFYDSQAQDGKPPQSAYVSLSSTTEAKTSYDQLYPESPAVYETQSSTTEAPITYPQVFTYPSEPVVSEETSTYYSTSSSTEATIPYAISSEQQYGTSESTQQSYLTIPSSPTLYYGTDVTTPYIVPQAPYNFAQNYNTTTYPPDTYLPPAPPPPYNLPYQVENPLYDSCPSVSNSCPRCLDVLPENFNNIYCFSEFVLVVATGLENYQLQRENEDPRSISFRQQNKLRLDVKYDGGRNVYNFTVVKDNAYGQRGGQINSGNFCFKQRVKSLHEISKSVTSSEKIFDFDIFLHASCDCSLFDNSPSYAMIMSRRTQDFSKPIQLTNDFVFFKIQKGVEINLPTCGYRNPGIPYGSSPGHVIKYNEAKTSDYQCYDKQCPECSFSSGIFNVPCNAKFVALVEVIESSASRSSHPVLEIFKSNLDTPYPQVKIRVKSQGGKAQPFREPSYDSNYIPGAGLNECTYVKVKILKDFTPEPVQQNAGTLTVVGKTGCSCHFLGPDSKYALLVSEYVIPPDRIVSAVHFKPVCIGEGFHSIVLCRAWDPYQQPKPMYIRTEVSTGSYAQSTPYYPPQPYTQSQSYTRPQPYTQSYNQQKSYTQPEPYPPVYNQQKPYGQPQSYNYVKSSQNSYNQLPGYNQPKPSPQSYNQPKPSPQSYNQPKPSKQSYNQQSYNQSKPSPQSYNQQSYNQQSYNQQSYNQPKPSPQSYNQQSYNQPRPSQESYNQPKQQQSYNQPKPLPQSYNQPKPTPESYNQPKPSPESYNQPKQQQSYNQPKPFPQSYNQMNSSQQHYDYSQTYDKQQPYNKQKSYGTQHPLYGNKENSVYGEKPKESCISQDMTCPMCHDNFEDITSDIYCTSPKTLLIRITKGLKNDGYSQCSSGFVTSLYDVTAAKGPQKSVLNVIYTIPQNCPCQMLSGDHFALMVFTNDVVITNPLQVHLSSKVHLYSLVNRNRVNLPFCRYASQYTQARSAALPPKIILDSVDKELMELRDQEMKLIDCPADGCPMCKKMEHDELQKLVCSSENTVLVSTSYNSQITRPKKLTNRKITLSQKAEHNYSIEIIIGKEDLKDADLCSLPYDKGSCNSKSTRYYYDSATESCKKFDYYGCEGNANRFHSEEDCKFRCMRQAKCEEGSLSFTRVIKKDVSLYLDYEKFEYLLPENCSCQYLEKDKQQSYIIFNDTIDESQDENYLLTKHYYIVPADMNNVIHCDEDSSPGITTDANEDHSVITGEPRVFTGYSGKTVSESEVDNENDDDNKRATTATTYKDDEEVTTTIGTTKDKTYEIKPEDDLDETKPEDYTDETTTEDDVDETTTEDVDKTTIRYGDETTTEDAYDSGTDETDDTSNEDDIDEAKNYDEIETTTKKKRGWFFD